MRVRHLLAAASLAMLAAPASAQNCAGFTDVPAAASYCGAVEWVKNRSITIGCTTTTTYCPNDVVSRSAMALFLSRMGDKLTPVIIEPVPTADSVSQLALATPKVVCPTGDYVVAGFPRRAHFSGRVNLYNPSANGDFVTEMVYTDDLPGSTNWKAVPNSAAYQTLYTGFTPAHDVSTYPQGFLNLDVGKTYRFGMRVSRYTGNNADVAAYCVNMVSIANRTSATAPFDEGVYTPAADAVPLEGRAAPRP